MSIRPFVPSSRKFTQTATQAGDRSGFIRHSKESNSLENEPFQDSKGQSFFKQKNVSLRNLVGMKAKRTSSSISSISNKSNASTVSIPNTQAKEAINKNENQKHQNDSKDTTSIAKKKITIVKKQLLMTSSTIKTLKKVWEAGMLIVFFENAKSCI